MHGVHVRKCPRKQGEYLVLAEKGSTSRQLKDVTKLGGGFPRGMYYIL